jgi:hypothetical protein
VNGIQVGVVVCMYLSRFFIYRWGDSNSAVDQRWKLHMFKCRL